jgi:hypothetical protein
MDSFFITTIFVGIILIGISFIIAFVDKKIVKKDINKLESKKAELIEIISDAEQMIFELNNFSDYVVEKMENSKDELEKQLNLVAENKKTIKNSEKVIAEKIKSEVSKSVLNDEVAKKTKKIIESRNTAEVMANIKNENDSDVEFIIDETKTEKKEDKKINEIENMYNKNNIKINENKSNKQKINDNKSKDEKSNDINPKVVKITEKVENKRVVNQQFSIDNKLGIDDKKIHKISRDSKKNKIMDLFAKGYTEAEIARQLDIGRGEIHLIVGVSAK